MPPFMSKSMISLAYHTSGDDGAARDLINILNIMLELELYTSLLLSNFQAD